MSANPVERHTRAIRKALRDGGRTAPAEAITRYARALALADRAWDEIPSTEDGLTASTDRGGDKPHPAIRVWLDASKAAVEFGQALGLEPVKPQGKPGRPMGSTVAKDRPPIMGAPRLTRVS